MRWLLFVVIFIGGEHEPRSMPAREQPSGEVPGVQWHEVRNVRVTFYCARGNGCTNPICGRNRLTACGRDASKGGIAVDKRRIPFGALILLPDGRVLEADDTFGKRQRESDYQKGIFHLDIRVTNKTHADVRRMGVRHITIYWRMPR